MRKIHLGHFIGLKISLVTSFLVAFSLYSLAQPTMPDSTNSTSGSGSWLDNNWPWLVGVVVLVLLMFFFLGGNNAVKRNTSYTDRPTGSDRRTVTDVERP